VVNSEQRRAAKLCKLRVEFAGVLVSKDDEYIVELEPGFVLKLAKTYGEVLDALELTRLERSQQSLLRNEVAKHLMVLVTDGVRDAERLRDAATAYARQRLD
jgi:hypothetical protein